MAVTRVTIVRHGETEWNVASRFQGQKDSRLSDLGIEQAQALAKRAARCRFDVLYSSDLGRARQTARAITEKTGLIAQECESLRERHMGIFEGLTRTEVEARYPEEIALYYGPNPDYQVPEGESFRQSADRFTKGIEDLARQHLGKNILIVAHGGVLGGFLRNVLGVLPEYPRRFKRFNGSWNVFTWFGSHWMLETWGDVSHLDMTRSLDDI